jgi:hypothetical protein
MEEVRAVFAALSRSNGNEEQEAFITHAKLEAACREFEVRGFRQPPIASSVIVQQNPTRHLKLGL